MRTVLNKMWIHSSLRIREKIWHRQKIFQVKLLCMTSDSHENSYKHREGQSSYLSTIRLLRTCLVSEWGNIFSNYKTVYLNLFLCLCCGWFRDSIFLDSKKWFSVLWSHATWFHPDSCLFEIFLKPSQGSNRLTPVVPRPVESGHVLISRKCSPGPCSPLIGHSARLPAHDWLISVKI